MSDTTPTTSRIALIWQPELCKLLGRSSYTITRWVKECNFPKPIRITEQSYAWRVVDVERWIDARERARRKPNRRGSLMEGDVLVQHTKKESAT